MTGRFATDPRLRDGREETDEALMRRVASGDLEALGGLVERHHQGALGFAFRLAGDRETARDAVQEAFLRLAGSARRYRPRGAFRSYLLAVVRNVLREERRVTTRERLLDPGGVDGTAAPVEGGLVNGTPTPEAILREKDLRTRLSAALLALPEDLRVVFVLSEMEGLSYSEIGRICGCPIGTVASRKHAAVMRLRADLRSIRNGG